MTNDFKISDVETIIKDLTNDYQDYKNKVLQIREALDELEQNPNDEKKIKECVNELQEYINELYTIKCTDNLIELQVIVNEYRHKYNILDESEVINEDEDGKYVQ